MSEQKRTVAQRPDSEQLSAEPAAAAFAAEMLYLSGEKVDPEAFLSEAVSRLRQHARAEAAVVATAERGSWNVAAEVGTVTPLPAELFSEVLDKRELVASDRWLATALSPEHEPRQEVVALRGGALSSALFNALATALGAALGQVRTAHQRGERLRRLEALLGIAQQWSQTRELVPLLTAMAEAATRLVGADRASIFLWDRANRTLVGRPALGVADGELRIPDDAGVVGQVVQTGEPCRVDRAERHSAINRDIDRRLGYRTETLLCVPLKCGDGKLLGAFETINKNRGNFTNDDQQALVELSAHAATALENTRDFEQLLSRYKLLVDQAAAAGRLIGESPAVEALRSTIARLADTELAVLILGENGTGKEIVSQAIHYQSRRRDQPLVAVNCAAIPENLLESELFGHEQGAFTDARERRIGKFELASRGTLFLDEIGDLSLGGQSKLLRVLEDKTIVRVGGSQPIHTDVRVIAATNQNLAERVRQKRFREDLYFRLNVVTLELPPLRDRGDDVLLLAEHFLAEFCRSAGRRKPKLLAGGEKRLRAHSWPGNVRELRNVMERLAYLSTAEKIDAEDLEFILAPGSRQTLPVDDDLELTEATIRFQQEYILRAIERSGQNMSQSAERLGLHRSNLYRKMRQLGMQVDE